VRPYAGVARDLAAEKSTPAEPQNPIPTPNCFGPDQPFVVVTMQRQSVMRLARQYGAFPVAELPPPYLAPSLHFPLNRSSVQSANFSSTSPAAGKGRDMNKARAVSAIHRTGPRFRLGASKYPLPKPVSPERLERREPTPDHGLWGFFPKDRQALSTPEYDNAHG
jgi:large subunit ribosomal protein L47